MFCNGLQGWGILCEDAFDLLVITESLMMTVSPVLVWVTQTVTLRLQTVSVSGTAALIWAGKGYGQGHCKTGWRCAGGRGHSKSGHRVVRCMRQWGGEQRLNFEWPCRDILSRSPGVREPWKCVRGVKRPHCSGFWVAGELEGPRNQ